MGGRNVSREPPPGAAAQRGSVYVRDGDVVFVCLEDRPRGELIVVTLWEEGETPAVPRRFTEALKRDDERHGRRVRGGRRPRGPRGRVGRLRELKRRFDPDGRLRPLG